MLTLFILAPFILFFVAVRLVTRLLFGFNRPYRRFAFGHHNRFGHRGHGFGGGILTILSLVAFDHLFLDRLFLGRRW